MTDKKKEWREPELIVLARNNPEEAVLIGCKAWSGENSKGGGYGNVNKWCIYDSEGSCYATKCEAHEWS